MEISFSDGSVKKISSDGSEDIRFPDGTRVAVASNGDRTLVLANGQKEFHTAEYKVTTILTVMTTDKHIFELNKSHPTWFQFSVPELTSPL